MRGPRLASGRPRCTRESPSCRPGAGAPLLPASTAFSPAAAPRPARARHSSETPRSSQIAEGGEPDVLFCEPRPETRITEDRELPLPLAGVRAARNEVFVRATRVAHELARFLLRQLREDRLQVFRGRPRAVEAVEETVGRRHAPGPQRVPRGGPL